MPPPRPDPALQSAIRHHQAGRLDKAESIYRQVLARQPSQPDALHQLGIIAARRRHSDEAETLIRRAIDARPNFPDALANLANVLIGREKFADAATALQQSLALNPQNPIALSNLSFALRSLGRFDEAADSARRSLALAPDRPDPLNNLGSALEELGQFEEANDCFRRAIARDPSAAGIHLNLAQGLLRLGDHPRGWVEYEWRWKSPTFRDAKRAFPEPRWDGKDLAERTIFLHAEQGLGDTIQFLRYVPLVKTRGAGRVILEVPPALKRVAGSIAGVDELIAAAPGERPQGDVRCPLMSLPLMLGMTQLGDISREVSHLSADAELTARWAQRLRTHRENDPGLRGYAQTPASSSAARLNVGLLASGNPNYRRDRERSIPASALAPLRDAPTDVAFYSLKKRATNDAPLNLPIPITDWTDELTDFADTAAFISSLDLVISVDTAVAHLAAAMGKSTWLLLSMIRDWRWPIEGEETPWYPSMRLFRQQQRDQWEPVLARVAKALTHAKTG